MCLDMYVDQLVAPLNGLAQLANGMLVKIRPIRQDGARLLVEGIARLSERSRQMRFFSTRADYSEREVRHLVECDGIHALTLVAAVLDDGGAERESIAAAHFAREREGSESAEVAIAVLDQFCRIGIGTALIRDLAERAKSVGVHQWTGFCSPENRAVQRLIEKVGQFRVTGCFDATLEFAVDLV